MPVPGLPPDALQLLPVALLAVPCLEVEESQDRGVPQSQLAGGDVNRASGRLKRVEQLSVSATEVFIGGSVGPGWGAVGPGWGWWQPRMGW